MDQKTAISRLKSVSSKERRESNERFGILGNRMLGVSVPDIRKLAKEIGKDHLLAQELWKSGIHEARILATMIDNPLHADERQLEKWVKDLDSWDICDHFCGNLADKTPFAYRKAVEWTTREREYEKRAGFALIAYLAVHDKKADDRKFLKFLSIIKREAEDDRNFVKKAVNWALREIGKRNLKLNKAAIETAKEIRRLDSKSAKWIASDAIRELQSDAVQRRIKKK